MTDPVLTVRLPPELRARLDGLLAQGYDLDHIVARALEQLLDRRDEIRRTSPLRGEWDRGAGR